MAFLVGLGVAAAVAEPQIKIAAYLPIPADSTITVEGPGRTAEDERVAGAVEMLLADKGFKVVGEGGDLTLRFRTKYFVPAVERDTMMGVTVEGTDGDIDLDIDVDLEWKAAIEPKGAPRRPAPVSRLMLEIVLCEGWTCTLWVGKAVDALGRRSSEEAARDLAALLVDAMAEAAENPAD